MYTKLMNYFFCFRSIVQFVAYSELHNGFWACVQEKTSVDEKHYISCFQPLQGSSTGPAVKSPSSAGLRSSLDATDLRNDEVRQLLTLLREVILNCQYKISYKNSQDNTSQKIYSMRQQTHSHLVAAL